MSEENVTENLQPPVVETPTPSLVTEGTKPAEGEPAPDGEKAVEPPVEVVPLAATDITFPEDVEVNSALVDEFLAVVNNAELDGKGRAQALVDLQIKAMREASEAGSREYDEMQTKWRAEVKADPAFAGEKFDPAIGRIGRLLSEYGSEEVLGVLDLTGAGNNLHILRLFDKIAGKLVEGEPAFGQPKTQKTSAAQRLFPSMKG